MWIQSYYALSILCLDGYLTPRPPYASGMTAEALNSAELNSPQSLSATPILFLSIPLALSLSLCRSFAPAHSLLHKAIPAEQASSKHCTHGPHRPGDFSFLSPHSCAPRRGLALLFGVNIPQPFEGLGNGHALRLCQRSIQFHGHKGHTRGRFLGFVRHDQDGD